MDPLGAVCPPQQRQHRKFWLDARIRGKARDLLALQGPSHLPLLHNLAHFAPLFPFLLRLVFDSLIQAAPRDTQGESVLWRMFSGLR